MAAVETATGDSTQDRMHYKQKRARSQLSCRPCRQGKLKCDREHPCNQCIKRSRDSACVYLPPAEKKKNGQNVRNRIQHLEKMVVDLMSSKQTGDSNTTSSNTNNHDPNATLSTSFNQLTPPQDLEGSNSQSPDDPVNALSEGAFGRMQIGKHQTHYVGDSHWSAILNEFSDLKRDLSEDEGSESDDSETDEEDDLDERNPAGITSLLQSPARMSKAELIQQLPQQSLVDRYVSQWFNAPDPFKTFVHSSTFQDEYGRFWKDPARTPTMWIGLLYAIISLSARIPYLRNQDPGSPEAQASLLEALKYHELAASAAILADYTKPKRYTIECLMMYISGLRSQLAFVDTWQLLGLVMRLALRLGYHRDGSHFPNLSVFEQEMRRRAWHALYMVDTLISFQIGLPGMLRGVNSDTQAPGNFMDGDLQRTMTTLPTPRPPEEITPVSYGIAKLRICDVFARAAELSHAFEPPSYDEIQRLDAQLDVCHDAIPGPLKARPVADYIAERAETMMWSLNLELLYLKSKIVLHRRYMKIHDPSPNVIASRQICVAAAMKSLSHHEELWLAGQKGGQFEMARVYMGSISSYDFLLASMVLCLELAHSCDTLAPPNGKAIAPDEYATIKNISKLLATTKEIWFQDIVSSKGQITLEGSFKATSTAKETAQAAKAVGTVLERVQALEQSLQQNAQNTAASTFTPQGMHMK